LHRHVESRWPSLAPQVGIAALLVAALVSVYAGEEGRGEPVRVLAFGDSLFAGYGLDDPADAFPAVLERALTESGYHVRVIPGGVSGDTTRGGLNRIEWSLGDDPDAAIVALGANDMLRGLEPARMRENLARIVARFESADVEVLLVGLPALGNWGQTMQAEYRAAFRDVAETEDVPLHPNLLAGVAGVPELNQPDGIHPTAEGVERIVEAILPAVSALVDDVRAARAKAGETP